MSPALQRGGHEGRRGVSRRLSRRPAWTLLAASAAGVLLACSGQALADRPEPAGSETDHRSVVILHTNDLHDHVRPGERGVGGLPYVSGYVAQVRAKRDDVLLIDAGDVAEKGDLVAFLTGSELTFELMGRMRYDAIAVGNHEHNFGLDALRRFNTLTGDRMLTLNLVTSDGMPLFAPSRVVEVGGVRVGLVGLALPRPRDTLDPETSGERLAAHARMLREQAGVELVVVTTHVGEAQASAWSRQAPEVDVFVTGHTHVPLDEPVTVEETGALIVQAGSNARWIGRLELAITADGRIDGHRGRLIELEHARVPVDAAMREYVASVEAAHYPGADKVVTVLDEPLGWFAIARLAADAVRAYAGADIGLYHPTHVVRNVLPAGPVSVNALFRTAADRGHPLVRTTLSGAVIEAYIEGLARRDYDAWGQTQWAGFELRFEAGEDGLRVVTDLEPDREYDLVMPEREWEKRFLRLVERHDPDADAGVLADGHFEAVPAGFHSIDTKRAWFERHAQGDVHAVIAALARAQGDADPMERRLEPRILERLLVADPR